MGRQSKKQWPRSGVEMSLLRRDRLKRMLCDEAPTPRYPVVISRDIPRKEMVTRAKRALAVCPQVKSHDFVQFCKAVDQFPPDDDMVMFQILKYMAVD